MIDSYNNSFSIFKRKRLNINGHNYHNQSVSSIGDETMNERLMINGSMSADESVHNNDEGSIIHTTEDLFKTSES